MDYLINEEKQKCNKGKALARGAVMFNFLFPQENEEKEKEKRREKGGEYINRKHVEIDMLLRTTNESSSIPLRVKKVPVVLENKTEQK